MKDIKEIRDFADMFVGAILDKPKEAMMAKQRTVRLELNPIAASSRIFLDGEDISSSVTDVVVRASASGITEVTLTMFAKVEVEGESEVVLRNPK